MAEQCKCKAKSPRSVKVERVGQRLLGIPQVADYLGCTKWAVRDLVWSDRLPVVKWGREKNAKQFVDVRDLDAFIKANKSVPTGASQ